MTGLLHAQESIAFTLIGILLGLLVVLYCSIISTGNPKLAKQAFNLKFQFNGTVFFYVLLPPIILDGGYNMQKARFFRNIMRIMTFACLGTLVSTLIIGFM